MLTLALEAARAGARVLREAGMAHRAADAKSGIGDWVTRYDRDSEAAIVEVLRLGVVIAPWLGLEFAAQRGGGATLNGEPLPGLPRGDPARSVVATGFPFKQKQQLPRYEPVLHGALRRFEDLRRAGSAALDLSWSAAGTLDGFFEVGLGPWDIAAGAAILLEVGGRVTDWSGGDGWLASGDVLAGPVAVHEVLVQLAAQPPQG
jgi:myo-inositol-1(or 4)-monophosphatase